MRIGVVGAGAMGKNHARALVALGHQLSGIVDLDENAARATALAHGVPSYADLRSMLATGKPDAVVVATPTAAHEKVTLEALAAGLHVLVEKPIAPDLAAARRMADAAASADRVLAVGHVERHNPVVGFAKRALAEGRFGRPITLSTRRVSRYPGRVRDVGCLLDIGIHDIDVLNHLAGALPEKVYALGGRHVAGGRFEDHANVLLAYPGGLKGAVEVNWLTPRKIRRLSLTCDQAFVECDYMEQRVEVSRTTFGTIDEGDLSKIPIETHVETVTLQREEPLQRELSDFVRAIETKGRPLADAEAGIAALLVAHAALRSLETGEPEAPNVRAAKVPA